MFYLQDWFTTKKSEKTEDWAQSVIRWIRMNMRQLISDEEASEGVRYLLGEQSLDYVKELFQNPATINLTDQNRRRGPYGNSDIKRHENHDEFLNREMSGVHFRPVKILQKFFSINKSEMKKMGVVVDVRSIDPTTSERKKRVESFLKNRPKIEQHLSEIFNKIGQPGVKMDHYSSRFGEEPTEGNTGQFDAMGMDGSDPADVTHFIKHFYKLPEEISLQDLIDYCIMDNDVDKKMENWMLDIWAKFAICAACHVSDVTGKITYDYIAPETVWIYGGGRRQDYNDANGKCYQQKISIKELLDRFGNSFDFKANFDKLLQAVSFAGMALEWTGIAPSWDSVSSGSSYWRINEQSGVRNSSINDFMALKVLVGYVEWSSQNQETFGETDKSKDNSLAINNQPPDGERYQTKARFETPTYKSFFLAVSLIDQVLFNFGEATYQQIEGYSDFNTNFSIITWKGVGTAPAIIAKPFIDIWHELWFKWKYEIRRAKPRGTAYNYEAILELMESVYTDQELNREAKLSKMLSFLDSSASIIYAIPKGPDGKPLVSNPAELHKDLPNGLSPESKMYWELMVGLLDELQEVLTGKSPLRAGDPGASRDSMNNQFKALEYSQNATYYVPEMLTFMYEQLAVKTGLFAQDIIQFKDYNTLAYKYLEDAVGEAALDNIGKLKKKAMHRYGIFVESLDQSASRAKLSARIDFALQNKTITNAQALIVEGIKSPTKAFLWLAYFEEKTAKDAQKRAMQLQQMQQQGEAQKDQRQMQIEKLKGDYTIQAEQIKADAAKQGHIITQQGGITKKAMEHTSDVIQIEQQARADLQRESASIDATGKQNPQAPPPAPIPTGGPAPLGAPQQQGGLGQQPEPAMPPAMQAQ